MGSTQTTLFEKFEFPRQKRGKMKNFFAFVLTLTSAMTATTSETSGKEVAAPRPPKTFIEKAFFAGLDAAADGAERYLPQVFSIIPFPGEATHKTDVVKGQHFKVRTHLWQAPQKTVEEGTKMQAEAYRE